MDSPQNLVTGINDLGEVVGWSVVGSGNDYLQAFIWTAGGGFQALGSLAGFETVAMGINDAGQVVGYSGVQ